MSSNQDIIVEAFERRAEITPRSVGTQVRDAVMDTIERLDRGEVRVAEKNNGDWVVNDWVKKAVLLSFRIEDNRFIKGGFTTTRSPPSMRTSAPGNSARAACGSSPPPPPERVPTSRRAAC